MCSDSKKTILHILTREPDEVAEAMMRVQRAGECATVRVISLAGDHPDYDALLEAIFTADAIQSW